MAESPEFDKTRRSVCMLRIFHVLCRVNIVGTLTAFAHCTSARCRTRFALSTADVTDDADEKTNPSPGM